MTEQKNEPTYGTSWEEAQDEMEKAAEAAKERDKARLEGDLFRFRLDKGQEATITVLSNSPLLVSEHQFEANGSYYNFECPPVDGPDPIKEQTGKDPYKAAMFVIIDHSSYTSKKGKEYKDTVKLLPVKVTSTVAELLLKKSKAQGGLRGCIFDVKRTAGEKSYTIGDVYDFQMKLTEEQLVEKWGLQVTQAAEWLAPGKISADGKIGPVKLAKHFLPKSRATLIKKYFASAYTQGKAKTNDAPIQNEDAASEPAKTDDIPW